VNKVIWTYWNDKNIPDLVLRCLNSIKRQNEGYSVITLFEDDIPDEVYKIISPDVSEAKKKLNYMEREIGRPIYQQWLSDVLRMWLLKEFGGVWLDISTYCNGPIDASLEKDYDFYAQYHDSSIYPHFYGRTKEIPFFECIQMASNPNGEIVSAWTEETKRVWSFQSPKKYINYLTQKQKMNIDGIDHGNSYLWHMLALRSVLTKNPELIKKINTKPSSEGHYKLSMESDWNSEKMAMNYDKKKHPIIKLRGCERESLKIQEMIRRADAEYDR